MRNLSSSFFNSKKGLGLDDRTKDPDEDVPVLKDSVSSGWGSDYLDDFERKLKAGEVTANQKADGYSLLYNAMVAVLKATGSAKIPVLGKANLLIKHGAVLSDAELEELLKMEPTAFADSLVEVLWLPVLSSIPLLRRYCGCRY